MQESTVLERVSCFESVGFGLVSMTVSVAADLRLLATRLLLGSGRRAGSKCFGWSRFAGGCWRWAAGFRLLKAA